MRVPRTDVPALVITEQNGARIAYLPADIDGATRKATFRIMAICWRTSCLGGERGRSA